MSRSISPGRYVGTEEVEEDDEVFEEKIKVLTDNLARLFEESKRLETEIRNNLKMIGFEF
jgi:type I restriction enzyme M protein